MIKKLKKLDKIEVYVFLGIFLLLVLKFFLITKFTSAMPDFLDTYRFVSADSYDWIANGLRLFDNDSISFRNPGLVIIIKALDHLRMPYLLPFLGNLVFFALIVYTYKLVRLVASKGIALTLAVFIAFNYSFNLAADFILADIYAVSFIAMSLYYLLTKKYLLSFFLLGVSMLFQNIGYLLLLIWAAFFIISNYSRLKNRIEKKDMAFFIRRGSKLSLVLLPVILWHIYKFLKFGSPFYTKVEQFSLIHPHLNSLAFYFINSLSIFGFILIPFLAYSFFAVKKIVRDKAILLLLTGLIFNLVFWVLLYSWDDRRFLLYFMPFIYPLLGYCLTQLWNDSRIKFILALLLIYPTILPVTSFLGSGELPLFHNTYLKVATDNGKIKPAEISLQKRPGFELPFMDINPTLYSAIKNLDKNHAPDSTWYSFYTNYINQNFDEQRSSICIDKQLRIREYLVKSILLINKNAEVDRVAFNDCGAKN